MNGSERFIYPPSAGQIVVTRRTIKHCAAALTGLRSRPFVSVTPEVMIADRCLSSNHLLSFNLITTSDRMAGSRSTISLVDFYGASS
jgi:hypothetical protein